MSCVKILQGTPTWLPFLALNDVTQAPRTGITFDQLSVLFKKYTDLVFQAKVLTGPANFRENGNGFYEILFSNADLAVLGTFLYVVNGNGSLPLPVIRQAVGEAVVESAASYTPGTIALLTNIITGNLVDLGGQPLVGESISAKILSAPGIMGTSPNRGGIDSGVVSAKTDLGGFFALELLRGAVVDIVIPVINYRRTLTVPSNATDKLFDIP